MVVAKTKTEAPGKISKASDKFAAITWKPNGEGH
jgi:hypothetical protein